MIQMGINGSRIETFPLFPMLESNKHESVREISNKRFILFIGNLEPRKNLRGLLHSYYDSNLQKSGVQLHIVGAGGHGSSEITEFAKLIPGVILHGFLMDSEVVHLLQKCEAFVYPSFLEGFGVPVLEAIKYNCRLLLTNRGATPELAPQDAIMVDPQNHAELTRCLKQVVKERPDLETVSRKRIMDKYSESNFLIVMKENCPDLKWR
jgi:glycosyltransferase involved in cell wall biosynthesis